MSHPDRASAIPAGPGKIGPHFRQEMQPLDFNRADRPAPWGRCWHFLLQVPRARLSTTKGLSGTRGPKVDRFGRRRGANPAERKFRVLRCKMI